MSLGLYGFGMSLNDINDRRRDSLLASHRPIPSGRIGIGAAHAVCAVFAIAAAVSGYVVTRFTGAGWLSLVLVIWTGLLIVFYDFAGKYLVGPGLLTLGLIRFFHATIAAPRLPLLWHPLLLLNHVTIISLIAYHWESKRPALTRIHWWGVLGGLLLIDSLCVGLVGWRRYDRFGGSIVDALWIQPGLILPVALALAYAVIAVAIYRFEGRSRRAGQSLMLYGLLWLIAYDAAFLGLRQPVGRAAAASVSAAGIVRRAVHAVVGEDRLTLANSTVSEDAVREAVAAQSATRGVHGGEREFLAEFRFFDQEEHAC